MVGNLWKEVSTKASVSHGKERRWRVSESEPAAQTVIVSSFIHWKFAHVCHVTFAAKSYIHISPKEEEKMRPKVLAKSSAVVPVSSCLSGFQDYLLNHRLHLYPFFSTFTFVSASVSILVTDDDESRQTIRKRGFLYPQKSLVGPEIWPTSFRKQAECLGRCLSLVEIRRI